MTLEIKQKSRVFENKIVRKIRTSESGEWIIQLNIEIHYVGILQSLKNRITLVEVGWTFRDDWEDGKPFTVATIRPGEKRLISVFSGRKYNYTPFVG